MSAEPVLKAFQRCSSARGAGRCSVARSRRRNASETITFGDGLGVTHRAASGASRRIERYCERWYFEARSPWLTKGCVRPPCWARCPWRSHTWELLAYTTRLMSPRNYGVASIGRARRLICRWWVLSVQTLMWLHISDPVSKDAVPEAFWQRVVRREALFDREGMKGPLLRTVAAVC